MLYILFISSCAQMGCSLGHEHWDAMTKPAFNPKTFLSTAGTGREMMSFRRGQTIYAQSDTADALFVIQTGKVKISVKSQAGKEATLDILSIDDFVGNDAIAGQSSRTASDTA